MGMQYQDFLLEEFRTRRSRNPHYSLRAFARDLGMPASKLSQNLRGLCGISVAKAQGIAEKLQMRPEDRKLFLALVESQHARSRVAREQAASLLEGFRRERGDELQIEQFAKIRDWYHLAILELTLLKDFKPEMDWIAKRLGLPADICQQAVSTLEELGLLRINEGQWSKQSEFEIPTSLSARSVREHHKQLLTKAIVGLDQEPIENRSYESTTLAIDSSRLDDFKNLLLEFQRRVVRLAQPGDKDAIYVLSMQLFPLLETKE